MVCFSRRTLLWIFWVALVFLTGTYAALSLVTFSNIYNAYEDDRKNEEQLRAILAATIFGCFLVGAFSIFSFLVMLGKTILATGAGFGYGLLLSSTFHMGITSLLCALVMHGFEQEIEQALEGRADIDWQSLETNTYQSTWYFAYFSSAAYFLYFIWLLLSAGAFRREEQEKSTQASPDENADIPTPTKSNTSP